jgi:predicted component of type VI protein secretion system
MKLVIEDQAGTRSEVTFTGDEIVVGRGTDGVTFRMFDRDVSRRHARFVRSSGAVSVEDLGSLTGTRVNGERLSGRRRLRDGDLVEIGDYDLAIVPDSDGDRGEAAPPTSAPVIAPAPAPSPRSTPTAPTVAVPRPAASPLRRALLIGVVALVLGIVAGISLGLAMQAAPPSAPAAPAR